MECTLSLQLRRGCLFTRHIFERHHVFFTTDSGPITTEKNAKMDSQNSLLFQPNTCDMLIEQ